uniref:Uncharacterized protein n=1 Tax=Aegilops tauschii subsp. strangulata TaxID=200361 RepID=A0A453FE16_AEGTS
SPNSPCSCGSQLAIRFATDLTNCTVRVGFRSNLIV